MVCLKVRYEICTRVFVFHDIRYIWLPKGVCDSTVVGTAENRFKTNK